MPWSGRPRQRLCNQGRTRPPSADPAAAAPDPRPGWHAWAAEGYALQPDGALDRTGAHVAQSSLTAIATAKHLPWPTRRPTAEELSALWTLESREQVLSELAATALSEEAGHQRRLEDELAGRPPAPKARRPTYRPGCCFWMRSPPADTPSRPVVVERQLDESEFRGPGQGKGLLLRLLPRDAGSHTLCMAGRELDELYLRLAEMYKPQGVDPVLFKGVGEAIISNCATVQTHSPLQFWQRFGPPGVPYPFAQPEIAMIGPSGDARAGRGGREEWADVLSRTTSRGAEGEPPAKVPRFRTSAGLCVYHIFAHDDNTPYEIVDSTVSTLCVRPLNAPNARALEIPTRETCPLEDLFHIVWRQCGLHEGRTSANKEVYDAHMRALALQATAAGMSEDQLLAALLSRR